MNSKISIFLFDKYMDSKLSIVIYCWLVILWLGSKQHYCCDKTWKSIKLKSNCEFFSPWCSVDHGSGRWKQCIVNSWDQTTRRIAELSAISQLLWICCKCFHCLKLVKSSYIYIYKSKIKLLYNMTKILMNISMSLTLR